MEYMVFGLYGLGYLVERNADSLADIEHVTFFYDINVFTENFGDHVRTLVNMLERLRNHGLAAQQSKSKLGFHSLNYLCFFYLVQS